MKYEKFEEWMIGKTIRDDYGDKGVVTREHDKSDGCVWVEWDGFGEAWTWVNSLVFLNVEVKNTREQENKPIPWEIGQEVWDVCYGKGKVVEVTKGDYPVVVQFALDEVMSYTLQGKVHNDYNRTLFFSEPTVIADTMPPKKPFTPTLKNGDEVVVRMVSGSISAFIVEEECEEYIKFKDVDYFLYKKRIASINKFGEQIKVDGVK